MTPPPMTAREIAQLIASPKKEFLPLDEGYRILLADLIEQALKEFASQEVEKAMLIAEGAMQNHVGFAGDYDAGACQAAKNIAFDIRQLWCVLRNDSQGRKA